MYPRVVLRSADATTPTQVDSAACLNCHRDVTARIVSGNGVRMRHGTCIANGTRCTACHGTAGHGAGSARQVFPAMDSCDPCHNGALAPSTCETCHTDDEHERFGGTNAWRVTHGANWRTTHGMGALTSCRQCHRTGYCAGCHYDQPHPDAWAGDHGRAAVATGDVPASCLNCHVKAFCDSCHGTAMPHPAGWMQSHLTATKGKGDVSCRRCHTETDCTVCHMLHTHPGRIDPGRRR